VKQQTREGSDLPVAQLRRRLRHLGIHPKKSLAQHFLVDENVLKQFVSAAQLVPEDVVMEVGPGLGILTRELAKKAKQVIAVEKDDRLAAVLQQELVPLSNITVLNADILQTDPAALLPPGISSQPDYKVVADLPYYITSAVLRHFLEASVKPSLMVVMVQREVGEAIAAQPGQMSLLAVSIQFYGKPAIVEQVSSQSFYPQPKVDSSILRIDLYKHPPIDIPDVSRFFETVRAGFSARRKQLRNALAQGLGLTPSGAVALLDSAAIASNRRAQSLSLAEWARVCEAALATGAIKPPC